jgi:hypothetical protein
MYKIQGKGLKGLKGGKYKEGLKCEKGRTI